MNATTLQLGPLTLPWSLLALLLGVWLGTWWHERWALRRQLAPGPHGWALPLLALLAARAGFVLAWWPQYAQAPLTMLDVRDGGFQPWAGWAAAALLIASQFAVASPATRKLIARIALPAILLMEVCGAVLVSLALYRVGEGSRPWLPAAAHPGAAPNPSDAPRTGDTP